MGESRIDTSQAATVPPTPVRAAIAQGAARTGMGFDFLLAQARVESGLNPAARAGTSSASGLFQFIESTWLATLHKHGPAHGMGHLSAAIANGPGGPRVADPALRQQILSLRHDPAMASLMAGALAQDNRAALMPVLGREPDAGELYLAHFLGSGGASRFLTALQSDPAGSAAALFPKPAAANRAIFYERGGKARSLAEVMDLVRGKMARAMDAPGAASQPMVASGAVPHTQSFIPAPFRAAQSQFASAASGFPAREATVRPLSDVLRHSFGASDSPAGEHVRRAYGRLRSFGL